MKNFIRRTDAYKHSHYALIDPRIHYMNSYFEARSDKMFSKLVFFGMQGYLNEYLRRPITMNDVEQAKERTEKGGLPFNYAGWKAIVDDYDGYLPLIIESVDEGSVNNVHDCLIQVRNTDRRFPWLAAGIETSLHRLWYPCTVASLSRSVKEGIYTNLLKTSDIPEENLKFKLQDFGARGSTSGESAGIGGAAHLINFFGTDTDEAIDYIIDNYDSDVCGFSIPASEHSTVTCWGRDHEYDMFAHMVNQYAKPGAKFACVSDSYNIYEAISTGWAGLKDEIRNSGATLVIRPDSGKPIEKIILEVSERIFQVFDKWTVNSKGFKVFEPCVAAIQGDGCSPEIIKSIENTLIANRISTQNWTYGMGGGLLQKVNRDDMSFAMKTSAASYDGEDWFDVYKDPITDSGKRSRPGIQKGPMKVRYMNGEFLNKTNFSEIRTRAWEGV